MTNIRNGIGYAENARPYFPIRQNTVRSAERSKTIKKEGLYKYEEVSITVYGIYYVDDVFAAFDIC